MIEIIQQYWQSYLWTDGFQMTGVAMTAWLLVLSIAIGLVFYLYFPWYTVICAAADYLYRNL